MIERCDGRSAYRERSHGVQRVAVDLGGDEGEDEVWDAGGRRKGSVPATVLIIDGHARADVDCAQDRVKRRSEGEQHREDLAHDGRLGGLELFLEFAELHDRCALFYLC